MTISAIASGIFAIAKAIPQVMEIFKKMQELYISQILGKIDREHGERKTETQALVKAISKAETDEERMALSRLLFKHQSCK
jgi:hypothetical protein